MKRGAKILNLSSFRDDTNSPWDYTAFVRTFALYLDERLDCFITGKLQKRYTNRDTYRNNKSPVCDMKPAMLLDKMCYWQRLLDRATVTRPTGIAKTNKLVQISLYAVVQETFDLYKDISDGLALLLNSFFQLPYQSCVMAFQCCLKANKQFDELSIFYEMCRNIGIGRTSEYPSVQKISEELLDTSREFLRDQASLPANGSPSPVLPPIPPGLKASHSGCSSISYESNEEGETHEKHSEKESEYSSACTSLEDLMNCTEFGSSPSLFVSSDEDGYCEQFDKQSQYGDMNASTTSSTSFSCPSPIKQEQYPKAQPAYIAPEFVSFDDWPRNADKGNDNIAQEQKQNPTASDQIIYPTSNITLFEEQPDKVYDNNKTKHKKVMILETLNSSSKDVWELELAETATEKPSKSSSRNLYYGIQPFTKSVLLDNPHVPQVYNPFLGMTTELNATVPTIPATLQPTYSTLAHQVQFSPQDKLSATPTFQVTPTFSAQSPSEGTVALQHDPFATTVNDEHNEPNGKVDQHGLLSEQELWVQNQNKIIGKHLS